MKQPTIALVRGACLQILLSAIAVTACDSIDGRFTADAQGSRVQAKSGVATDLEASPVPAVGPEAEHGPSGSSAAGPVGEPIMITGTYLLECHWQERGSKMGCLVSAKRAGEQVDPAKFRVDLLDASGKAIEPSAYQQTITAQDTNQKVLIAFNTYQADVGVTLNHLAAPDEAPVSLAPAAIPLVLGKVVVFDALDYHGNAKEFGLGYFTLENDFSDISGSIGSVRIPPNMAIEICGFNGSGNLCRNYYGDISNLRSIAWGVSRFRVYTSEPFVTVFRNANHEAAEQLLAVGSWTSTQLDLVLQDQISSLHIPPGLVMDTYLDAAFSEGLLSLPTGDFDLTIHPAERNDKINSLRVRLASP